jgi:hypothetical protein
MRTEFDGKEHNFSEGELRDLHRKNKKISINEFKKNAAPDLWSSHVAKLEKVCSLQIFSSEVKSIDRNLELSFINKFIRLGIGRLVQWNEFA